MTWPATPDARDRAEATVVLGREIVDEALADLEHTARLYARHTGAVREAFAGIRARRKDVTAAQAYAVTLPREVVLAVAGAWCADVAERALALLGIREVPEDDA
ncbi:MAG: hypothetical protein KGR26_13155 [Cyanobacteria bacterium REEB65]|nr:hypothetical protein [Cyanobacteria bacterium REEB65]